MFKKIIQELDKNFKKPLAKKNQDKKPKIEFKTDKGGASGAIRG